MQFVLITVLMFSILFDNNPLLITISSHKPNYFIFFYFALCFCLIYWITEITNVITHTFFLSDAYLLFNLIFVLACTYECVDLMLFFYHKCLCR